MKTSPQKKPTATTGAATSTKPAVAVAAAAAAEDTVMPLPTAKKLLVPYFIDLCDAAVVSYYSNAAIDYTKVEVHNNGMVPKGSCKFMVAADGMAMHLVAARD